MSESQDIQTVKAVYEAFGRGDVAVSMHLHHWFDFRGDRIDYYRGTEDTAITLDAPADASN